MDTEYTVVVPDVEILSCVCGTNDNNLKLIEDYLGIPVFTRGNELSVNTDNDSLREKFRYIIDRVVDELGEGSKNGTDIIASVLNIDRKADMNSVSIAVPGAVRKVYPHTRHQAEYIQSMREKNMVFCIGAAGSGKTFLAVAEALRLLPGDLKDKITPYLRPLYDSMELILPKETMKRLLESELIEIAPLAYMRGRTLNNSVVILDEAQNTTREQMKMFLTRMGENSKVFVTGDETQIDLPKKVPSGLKHAVSLLEGIEEIGINRLAAEDVVRNPLVQKIVKAYENEQNED